MKESGNLDGSEDDLPKFSFQRLQYPLSQVVDVAIPFHVEVLKQHNENIEQFKTAGRDRELRSEQIKATKTVLLLKADLYELENLNRQVSDEDTDLFYSYIKKATKDAVEILSLFMDLHSDIFSPLPEDPDPESIETFPKLVCNYDEEACDNEDTAIAQAQIESEQKQLCAAETNYEALNFLQKEFLEINNLIKHFAKLVFRQKDSVDTIQDNIEQTAENVYVGTEYLKKASNYKAATFPIAGAVIGGLILGPVGALAGFKIFGSFACLAGGSILGYGAGVKLKHKKQLQNELEMKALTYPSKSQSRSSPDLTFEDSDKKDS